MEQPLLLAAKQPPAESRRRVPPPSSPAGSGEGAKEGRMGSSELEEGECGFYVKRRKVSTATDVSMVLDFLECPVCYHLLRAPIYQCAVGHIVCSSCRAKFRDKCHCCSLATGYNRCHIIEHVVDCTKVPCCYGNFGCTEKITYYEKENHEKVCPHAPCFCPEEGCKFTGSTAMLLNHFSGVHKWHCTKISYNKAFRIRIAQGSASLQCEDGQLFVVNMVLEPPGGVISVFYIQPGISLDQTSSANCQSQVLT